MRRLDEKWLDAMEAYVTSTIHYLTANMLFAHQGGPIIAGQIENELGEERVDETYMDMPVVDDDHPTNPSNHEQRDLKVQGETKKVIKTVSEPSVQEYADWCGSLVMRLAPKVVWTMCNGLSANNTIVTCNGECSTKWLEDYGSSGRIQVDQPPMWSEGKTQ
jgi:Glycosyl hydrolases family 35